MNFLVIFQLIFSLISFSTGSILLEPVNPLNWIHTNLPIVVDETLYDETIKLNYLCDELVKFKFEFNSKVFQNLVNLCKKKEKEVFFNKLEKLCSEQDLDISNDINKLAKRKSREIVSAAIAGGVGLIGVIAVYLKQKSDANMAYEELLMSKNETLKLEKTREFDIKLESLNKAMAEFELSRDSFVPNSFLKVLNIPIDEHYSKSTKLQSCSFSSKTKILKLKFTKDLIDKNLEFLTADPFKIILKNSNYCYLEYEGPKNIIYNKSDHSYCDFDSELSANPSSVFFSNCNFKPYSTLNKFKKVCQQNEIDKHEFTKVKRGNFFIWVYCFGSQIYYENQINLCPNHVFRIPFGKPLQINNKEFLRGKTFKINQNVSLSDFSDSSHYLSKLYLQDGYFKEIEDHHNAHSDPSFFSPIFDFFSSPFKFLKSYFLSIIVIIFLLAILFFSKCIFNCLDCCPFKHFFKSKKDKNFKSQSPFNGLESNYDHVKIKFAN